MNSCAGNFRLFTSKFSVWQSPALGAGPTRPDAISEFIRRDQERFADIKRRANIQVVE